MKKLLLVALLLLVCSFIGCGGGSGGGNTPPPSTPTLQTIQVTPANPTIAPGATQQFTATGSFSDGSTRNLTSTANWLSSTASVATISTGGLATAVAGGPTTISASFGGITGSTTLTVANSLVSIAVTPAAITINPVAPGNTQQFTAIGTFADKTTQDLTATATWQSSSSTIATISSGGLATGVAPGGVTISATSSGVTGTATLTVANPLQVITVTPANSSAAPGTKPQFTATGTYFDKTSQNITALVAWSSSNTAAATISTTAPTQGLATTIAAGQTTITATCTPPSTACPTGSAVSGSTGLTVTSAHITKIDVTPVNSPISLGLQQQYDALATFSDGSQQDVTNVVTWTSSDPTSVTITVSGLATGVKVTTSPVTITAKAANGVTGSTTTTVNAGNLVSIAIKPANITKLAQGTSQQFSAIGTFNNGGTLDITNQVSWQSSDTTIAVVLQKTGKVIAAKTVPLPDNNVTISATLQSISQSITIDVTNATPVSITVTPVTAQIPVGATQTFHATGLFTDGTSQDITVDSTWTSSNPAQATVTIQGRVLGVAPTTPNVTISAAFGGVSGSATLVVSTATLSSITITPPSANLAPGSTITFQATGNYSDGSTANLTSLANWTSDAPAVATVSGGVTSGQSAGTANITASYGGQAGTAPVLVTASPLTAITVTPANPTSYIGVTLQFTAIGTAGAQSVNLTSSATWASSNPAVATVSNANVRQGIATGVGTGSSTITAVFAGVSGNTTLNVSNATLTKLVITPANPTIAVGSNLQFKATGTFSDGKTVDLTGQVTWNSSAPNVAPVTGGLASGATAGQTTITATFTQPGQATVSDQTTLTVQ